MQLSVIIVNYNVRAFLENALISVEKALVGVEAEVFVVDNASSDGSVEMVRRKFPSVRLIANQVNNGFGAANNQAMRDAQGEYLLLLNPDTIVQEDTIRTMIDYMQGHAEVGLAGCKILNSDGTLQLACRRSFPTPWIALTRIVGLSTLFPRSPVFNKYNLAYLDPDASYEVDAVSGSFMFVRRSVYAAIGGFDEQFFMYGEDLDWCYRVKQGGWSVAYVHSTQIIHYKGQSARRSDVDEVTLFYNAMRIFVGKYFRRGPLTDIMLRAGIGGRQWMAFAGKSIRPLRAPLLDLMCIDAALLVGEYIWFGEIFRFPAYAYPVILTVPGLAIIMAMHSLGVYTTRKLSISRTLSGVVVGYVVISALTFFFKQYGFSRMVVLISGAISLFALPGWRLLVRKLGHSAERHPRGLFGRRTLIVGSDTSGQAVLRKLRARIDDGYDVVGFIDADMKRVGDRVSGVEILGSIDNIGKVIAEQKVSEVIFSTDVLSYSDILAVISRGRMRNVNYRLVPNSLEVIIGKTHIDVLDDLPLVHIEYNIDRMFHRTVKRLFDLVISLPAMIFLSPFGAPHREDSASTGFFQNARLFLPKVVKGEWSLVGPPVKIPSGDGRVPAAYLGKPGLTGLVQINSHDELSDEETEKYNLYYAKNQSLMLDLEILLKSIVLSLKH